MAAHGNYQGYQGSAARHTPSGHHLGAHILDPRIFDLVELYPDIFEGKRVFDVGCNQGGVAVDIALHFKAASVHGIDLDATLIQHAKSHLSFKYSRLPPAIDPTGVQAGKVSSQGDDKLAFGPTPRESSRAASYFPVSAVLNHGHVLYPPEGTPGFPRNVSFEVGDVIEHLGVEVADATASAASAGDGDEMDLDPAASPKQTRRRRASHQQQSQSRREQLAGKYDVVLLLSVLKWIHIHRGDPILTSLFTALHHALSQGGVVVVEMQKWESYEKAAKKNPGLRGMVEGLKVRSREEVLQRMVEAGFEVVGEVQEKVDAKGKVRRREMVVVRKV